MRRTVVQHSAGRGSGIAQTDSLAAFRSMVSASFVPLRISTEREAPFAARMHSVRADDILFTEVTACPHLVERTPETIASGGSGYYKVGLLQQGSGILVQDGRETLLGPGALTITDTSRPYSLLLGESFRNLVMMFPKHRLPIPYAEQLTAVSLGEQHPALASVATAFLSQFPAQLTGMNDSLRVKLAQTGLDLVTTLVTGIVDADPAQRDPHHQLLQRIYAYIDDHLASQDLSPGRIAAAHYVSTSHLSAIFRRTGTTVSAWIRSRRLERCRIDLLDPVLADRTVASIAARWGFTEAAYFSRTFKSAFGVSPSELRLGERAATAS